jgi:glycyl-tRNA synthetase alpha chain
MLSFQRIIFTLQEFWANQGCVILQPYDLEVGAGTSHPATVLYALGPKPWRTAFVQPSRRPTDGRYGENPNRLQRFYQFQVLLKPAPENIQDLLIQSYEKIGIDPFDHDIRFVEDDWENPSLGASGRGWEVWLDGMEVTQFTYFQQVGGIECDVVSGEIAYGLERLAMCIQKKDTFFDLVWNDPGPFPTYTYGDLVKRSEKEFSCWYFEKAPIDQLSRRFEECLALGKDLLQEGLVLPAYEQCLQSNHIFNMLDARGAISISQRAFTIQKIRQLASHCCQQWMASS